HDKGRDVSFDFIIVGDPLSKLAQRARNDASAHAVALINPMAQRAFDRHRPVARSNPSSNGGVLEIVAGASAIFVQHYPAQLCIRQRGSTLKRRPGEVWQASK